MSGDGPQSFFAIDGRWCGDYPTSRIPGGCLSPFPLGAGGRICRLVRVDGSVNRPFRCRAPTDGNRIGDFSATSGRHELPLRSVSVDVQGASPQYMDRETRFSE